MSFIHKAVLEVKRLSKCFLNWMVLYRCVGLLLPSSYCSGGDGGRQPDETPRKKIIQPPILVFIQPSTVYNTVLHSLYFLILTTTLQAKTRQALLTPILPGRKKFKEDKWLAQGHSVSRCMSWDWNLVLFDTQASVLLSPGSGDIAPIHWDIHPMNGCSTFPIPHTFILPSHHFWIQWCRGGGWERFESARRREESKLRFFKSPHPNLACQLLN